MKVFVLSTGRSGSKTLANACRYIKNYSTGHEMLTEEFGRDRYRYPDNHIEIDNRLVWHLGKLNEIFGDEALYVHLKRDKDDVAKSFMNRFYQPKSIIDSFCEGIRARPPEKLDSKKRLKACYDYIDTVNSNVEFFLSNQSNTMILELGNIKKDFPVFWDKIGAEGDLKKALKELEVKHNSSSNKRELNLLFRLKLLLIREFRHLIMCIRSLYPLRRRNSSN